MVNRAAAWSDLLVCALAVGLSAQSVSKWVFPGKDGRLQYSADALGNRIMDFSHAGYMGGGITLPAVPVVRHITPVPGDNTAHIQAAIDGVSRRERDKNGFRGAVRLDRGRYDVAGELRITTSGVVFQGSGSGEKDTVIRVTGPAHRFLDISGTGSWQPEGTPMAITNAFVPFGSDSFEVSGADPFKPGDSILIQRPVTESWIRYMGMDTLTRDGKPQTWIKPGVIHTTDRTIRSISGKRITLDVPVSDSYDAAYLNPPGASIVKYSFPGRIQQVAVESLRVVVPAQDVPISESQYTLLRIAAVADGWIRDVTAENTQNSVTLAHSARRITLENVHIRHAVRFTAPASPADFAISGTQILLHRSSVTGKGVWPVVTQNGVSGPNVVLHFTADEAGVAPHQRWATGLLVDSSEFTNGTDRRPGIAFSNREYAGSGHGWSAGWCVAWNVKTDVLLVQQPPGAKNWCIGCTGRHTPILWHGNRILVPPIPSETFESPGAAVTPASLYLAQLKDRLGSDAVRRIGY